MSKPAHETNSNNSHQLEAQIHSFQESKQRLLSSKKQLVRLFNNMPGMVYRCALDKDLHPTLEFVSSGSMTLFGVEPDFLVSQNHNVVESMTHPDDLPALLKETSDAIHEKRPYKHLYRILFDSMQEKWIWDQGECIYDDDGTPLYLEGIMMDISAQKLREYELLQENRSLKGTLEDRYKFGPIIGKSQAMQEVFKLIIKASKSDANVIICGETGTGKDLVAQTIHEKSGSTGPYVPVNCGAIPENLMESEFFGHKKGAFSGATSDRQGYLAAADGGTLFLDEVGEIDLSIQVKLLRALESKMYTPVGSSEQRTSKFRLVAATNRNLNEMVRQGTMRSDFFYRLHVLPINIPPLRERLEDLPLLTNEFMTKYLGENEPIPHIPGKIRAALDSHGWPGNVRELQNAIERYLTFGEMVFSDLGIQTMESDQELSKALELAEKSTTLSEAMDVVERHMLQKALEKNKWRKGLTAKDLGLNMRTMQRKLKKHGL